jgi:hypothetical protein
MPIPSPTPIYRIIHVDNLKLYLERGKIHSPNDDPKDGLEYRTIHDENIQSARREWTIPCGPKGVLHDYVPFYFGTRSPMLLRLKTGRVLHYHEGQEPIIYLVSSVQTILQEGYNFVFSDGQGIKRFTSWYCREEDLGMLDWNCIHARRWNDTTGEPDRMRRKQAEFLIHRQCDWSVIKKIGVLNENMRNKVEIIMNEYSTNKHRPVELSHQWYY